MTEQPDEYQSTQTHDLAVYRQQAVTDAGIQERLEEILGRQVTTKEERAQQAIDCGDAVAELAGMSKRFKAYIGSVAARIITLTVWRAHPSQYTDEESFWLDHGWEPADVRELKLWAQFHITAVPLLRRDAQMTDEEIAELANKASPTKLQAIVATARSVDRQTAKKSKKAGDYEQEQHKKDQLRSVVQHAQALHDNDFKAQLDAENGRPPKVPIQLTYTLMEIDGQMVYLIKGYAYPEQVDAKAEHRAYYVDYFQTEKVDGEELSRALHEAESARNITPIRRNITVADDPWETDDEDDDLGIPRAS